LEGPGIFFGVDAHMSESQSPGLLSAYRVVDLSNNRAEMAGRVLADLGAEVIKVEPPGGCQARHTGPFEAAHEGGPDASLYWAALGLGKRSVVLGLRDAGDRARLLTLIDAADVVIESEDPGTMDALGLGYAALSARNPGLVYAAVTPFGQEGTRAARPASDLTLEAAGGLTGLQGDGPRPPIPVGYPQASFHGGAQAAADIVVALHERERSGLGQYLDVSIQAAVVWTLMNATGYPPNIGANPPGYAEQRSNPAPQLFPGLTLPRLIQCADGWVSFLITLPTIGPRTQEALMRWAEREGKVAPELVGINWTNWIADVMGGKLAPPKLIAAVETLIRFIATKTKAELQRVAVAETIMVAPIYTIADLLIDPHLAAREYWTNVGGRVHPGPFAKLSGTPIRLSRPAPALGADEQLLSAPPPARPANARPGIARTQSFAGLKVADFAWVGVGPIISKALADHGATVVHMESVTRPDVLRLLPPFKDGVAGINRAQFMANFNTSKLGLGCDLSKPEGRALARKVVDWADVVVESFTPGTLKKWGLDYATLSKDRPELVMLSTCLRGQTGPEAGYTGFGGQGAALAGFFAITGWPGEPPSGPWGAYTDFINPRFGVAALAAAIMHREKTGQGQHIDISQSEGGIRFMEPLILDYTVNGRCAGPVGIDSQGGESCPHGVYATNGVERFIAIEVQEPGQWEAFKGVMDLGALAQLDSKAERLAQKEAFHQVIGEWCREQDGAELSARLRAAGVPAYEVLYPMDLYVDAQLKHHDFFVTLDHGEMGPTPYDGLVTRFSATPGKLRLPGPCLGQDTDYVLREVLRLSEDEMIDLAVAGVLG
jgi:crotonobetainyl-CoA:carnitine CoA-transferase CaiB-like acyl-CoA transferase